MLWVLKRIVSMRKGSFKHIQQMFKLMDKKIFAILRSKFLFIWPMNFKELQFDGHLLCN